MATDLTAAQLVVGYWADDNLWVVSVVFLIFLLAVNAFSVGAYGELGACTSFTFYPVSLISLFIHTRILDLLS